MEERGPITAHIEGLEAHIRGMYDELVSEVGGLKNRTIQTGLKSLLYYIEQRKSARTGWYFRQTKKQTDVLVRFGKVRLPPCY